MNKLKITAAGWENYTGHLGMVEFKDGVSVDPVPKHMANRISAAVQMVEISEEGEKETGVASDILDYSDSTAKIETLETMSEEDVENEKEDVARGVEKKVEKYYTEEELLSVADKGGLKALRQIGDFWKVRERSIPALIEKILIAQSEHKANLDAIKKALENRVISEGLEKPVEVERLPTEIEEIALKATEAKGETVEASTEVELSEDPDLKVGE